MFQNLNLSPKIKNSYRYGFNGMERDDEVHGEGNSYGADYRQYDSRLARWTSVDPLAALRPFESPYAGFGNNPIYYIDPSGLTPTNGDEGGDEKTEDTSGKIYDMGDYEGFDFTVKHKVTPQERIKQISHKIEEFNNYLNASIERTKNFEKGNERASVPANFEPQGYKQIAINTNPNTDYMLNKSGPIEKMFLGGAIVVTGVMALPVLIAGVVEAAPVVVPVAVNTGRTIVKNSISKTGLMSGGTNFTYQLVINQGDFSRIDYFDVGLSLGLQSFWKGNFWGSGVDILGNGDFKAIGYGINTQQFLYRFGTNAIGSRLSTSYNKMTFGLRPYSSVQFGNFLLKTAVPLGFGIGEKLLSE